jgi:hypothetical protein
LCVPRELVAEAVSVREAHAQRRSEQQVLGRVAQQVAERRARVLLNVVARYAQQLDAEMPRSTSSAAARQYCGKWIPHEPVDGDGRLRESAKLDFDKAARQETDFQANLTRVRQVVLAMHWVGRHRRHV